MECRFEVGQKVCCVDNGSGRGFAADCSDTLVVGGVYTVRSLARSYRTTWVRLVESVNLDGGGYCYTKFRPLHETQINELREIAIKAFKSKKVTV
jgi:hypothetical protein